MQRRLPKPRNVSNNIQRRIFMCFVRLGGDPIDDEVVDELVCHLERSLITMPPAISKAVEIAWRSTGPRSNARVAEGLSMWEGRTVSVAAARKRVSRGAQLLEEAMRRRAWNARENDRENGRDSRMRSPR